MGSPCEDHPAGIQLPPAPPPLILSPAWAPVYGPAERLTLARSVTFGPLQRPDLGVTLAPGAGTMATTAVPSGAITKKNLDGTIRHDAMRTTVDYSWPVQARRPPRRELKARCFSTTHSAVLITTTSTVRDPRPVPPYQPKLAPSCPKLAPHCRPELAPDCPQLAPYCRPKLAPYCPQLAPYCQRCPPTHRSQCRTLRRPQRRLLRHQARQLQRHRTRRRQTRGARVSCANQNCAAKS